MLEIKRTPSLRFNHFTASWNKKELGYFFEFKNGVNATKEQYGKGVKFINVLDILNNDFIKHDKIIGSVDIDEKTFSKYEVKYGDILFQRSSETREEVGVANVYLDKGKNATFGGFVIRGKKIKEYDPVFMNYLLKTDMARKEITSKSGGSTRYNVGQEILKSVTVFLPELEEQRKIATFLFSIDKRLGLLRKEKALLQQYKRGVSKRIFTKTINFKDALGNPFPEWEKKRLQDVCELKNGYAFKSSSYAIDGDYKVITISNVQDGILDTSVYKPLNELPKDIRKHQILQKQDLLISLTGNVGRVALVNEDNCLLNQRVGKLIPFSIDRNFLFQLLKRKHFLNKMIALAQGGAQPNLSKSDIDLYEFLLPSLPEQKKIADFLTAIDDKISLVEQQIEKTKEYKKGLLQQMFVV